MPLLYSLGQHQALDEVVRGLLPTEKLFAYLDDVYVVTTPDRVATVYTLLQENLWVYVGVFINSGKTQVWNAAGRKPLVCEAMDRIAQVQNPVAKVWRGSEVPVDRQGVKVLGAPIGHPAFVAAQLSAVAEHQATLLQRTPLMPDLQSAWLLLLHCAGARATYFLRVVNPETAPMDLAYMCVKPQMRLYVCQALPPQNTKCVYMCVTKCVYMCVTKCVYMCVTKCVYMCVTKCDPQRSSLRSLPFARFARTFF